MMCTGVSGGGKSTVTRACSEEVRESMCVPEPYGGSLECYCRTDYCNAEGNVKAPSHVSMIAADHTTMLTVFTSAVLHSMNSM